MADIILGSGYVLIAELTQDGEVPADNAFEAVDASGYYTNQFGYTKGGATLAYETEYSEIKDDNGQINENYLSSDTATLKLGAFMKKSADMLSDLKKICPTASVTTDQGITTLKFGGVANDNNKKYAVRFIHKDKKLKVTIIGKNTDGFEFTFDPEDAAVIEPTFTASAMNSNGDLVNITYDAS